MPAVVIEAKRGVIVIRAERRGSNAGTAVLDGSPSGVLARFESKIPTRAPGTISTRGATCQTTSR